MNKWFLNLALVVGVSTMGFAQANSAADNLAAEKALEGKKIIDYVPQVGVRASVGIATDIRGDAEGEVGYIASPAILATVDLTQELYLTGEMAMSSMSLAFTERKRRVDLKLTTIDPTLLIGYYITPKISVFAGPQINLFLSAEAEMGDNTADVKDIMESNALGAVIGTKMHYANNLFSDVRFQYGFTEFSKVSTAGLCAGMISAGLYF